MAVPAERAHRRAILTVQNPNHVVGAVSNQQILLLRILRKGQIVDRSAGTVFRIEGATTVGTARLCRGVYEVAGYELALFGKYLNVLLF